MSGIDNSTNTITTVTNISEIVSALDSPNRYAFYAGNISELLSAVTAQYTDILGFITESGSASTLELASLLVNKGVLETLNANDSEFVQLILTSYVTEISVAGESTVVWIFYPMDYELVSSRPSMLIDSYSDEIYFDNIDVFYLDASNIMADVDVTYDQIYIDNIDVLYGNIALIDSAIGDEIYI